MSCCSEGMSSAATGDPSASQFPATLGQKTMANSLAVVIASDQSGVKVKGTDANDTAVTGAPVLVGAIATTGAFPTPVGADGRVAQLWCDQWGRLRIISQQCQLTSGDIAHDAADSGNPVKVGGKAAVSAFVTAVANGDRANLITDRYGRNLVTNIDRGMQIWKAGSQTTAQTGTAIWTPASGAGIVLTKLFVGIYGTTPGRVTFWFGASADTTYSEGTDEVVFDHEFVPSAYDKPGLLMQIAFEEACQNADYRLRLTTDANISIRYVARGFEETP